MSVTEPPVTDGVQPDQGQGDVGQTSGGQPYADYLARVPDEVRGTVEPVFKDWNSHVNSRFEEHANYRKQWEPYEQAGVTRYSPQDIQAAFDLLQNPDQLRSWADEQYGPVQAPEQQQPQPEFDLYGQPDQQQFEQLLESKLGPLSQELQQLAQWRQQQEQQAQIQQIQGVIDREIGMLQEKHAANLPEPIRENFAETVERFADKYANDPSLTPEQMVAKGWADFEALSNQLQTAALQDKVNQPAPAETGGRADLTPDSPKTLKEAGELALAQIRAGRAA